MCICPICASVPFVHLSQMCICPTLCFCSILCICPMSVHMSHIWYCPNQKNIILQVCLYNVRLCILCMCPLKICKCILYVPFKNLCMCLPMSPLQICACVPCLFVWTSVLIFRQKVAWRSFSCGKSKQKLADGKTDSCHCQIFGNYVKSKIQTRKKINESSGDIFRRKIAWR